MMEAEAWQVLGMRVHAGEVGVGSGAEVPLARA